jgi:DNA-binding GntR family transcriptional regulator
MSVPQSRAEMELIRSRSLNSYSEFSFCTIGKRLRLRYRCGINSTNRYALNVILQPSLTDQVVNAIISEIVEGVLPPNARLIQEELARAYGVSRQPVQQALLLLRNQDLIREAPGRGFLVAPLEIDFVRNLYEVRAVMEGLAARMAAERNSERARCEGGHYIAAGRRTIAEGAAMDQIEADMNFHAFIVHLSGNPLIDKTTAPHQPHLRRVMAEVLRSLEKMPLSVWDEHAAILEAIIDGDGELAEGLGRRHVLRAAEIYVGCLQQRQLEVLRQIERRRLGRVR